jgi:hypothetical protein
MTRTAPRFMHQMPRIPSLRAPLPALLLLVCLLMPMRAWAAGASAGDQQLSTKYFTIYYPDGEAKTAAWYASFADDVDVAVSELLGAEPVTDITLHIYATEADYAQVNPMAELHPGIMAHAIPEQRELGVAVERLRQEPPELARESFRHEMTHIVAGAISGQNLPIGFQEGLAQYDELSQTRGQEVVQALQQAQNIKASLLSWQELNDRRLFGLRLDVAYPESYSVMAFLAERYGMGLYSRFLKALGKGGYCSGAACLGPTYADALDLVYDASMADLEAQWQQYLPGFLKNGWKHNVLSSYDLAPGVTLYDAGRFQEARDYFAGSEKLYRDLGRDAKATTAAGYLDKADRALQASELTTQARQALEAHNYADAQRNASMAARAFETLSLTDKNGQASAVEEMAGRGVSALASLQLAKDQRQLFDLPQAQAQARQAGETFVALGDNTRVTEANQVLSELWQMQRSAALAALGAGGAVVLFGFYTALRFRKREAIRRLKAGANHQLKEDRSWL